MSSLNDLVLLYLQQASIDAPSGSYSVDYVPADGKEEITFWDEDVLGAQPSAQTLQQLDAQVETIANAVNDFGGRLAMGLEVTSTGTPALSAVYGIDQVSQDQLSKIASFFTICGILPSGATTFPYPEMTGVPHDFSGAQLVELLKAVGLLVYQLQVVLAERLQGIAAAWPSQAATIP